MAHTPDNRPPSLLRLTAWHGGIICVTAIAMIVISWFLLGMLAEVDAGRESPALLQAIHEHRTWLMVLPVPAFIAGLVMLMTARLRVLWYLIAMLFLVLPLALLLYAFLATMGQFYEPQTL